ncbi:cell death-inducing p53-target protein 1 isoform X1 [Siniperca chuatsi]|uniref:cell death-inducing p53-target protein 1 isoform X1 n=1 Tax=Siniperca chuatsi TaxID=119488 RepID=UPI001CE1FE75|nr:cell death-inducing p53-target protein 1 isoform X1 [Siniperca chuatsi]XP_044036495.1 cell death-inducing p53-target protein 1 isoform X1 [Siniperca chuatsi]XP_044036496.1 cell death-inducing p53-target protein 1 isoform X1 [Siniperca chuatsi]XP_044036497.1 cell death-inducing p53-target protein 1 isoform X1 [Siniperca chuatsi]
MSSDPPPPYPGGPSAPLIEEKNGQPVRTTPIQGQPLPPDYGPPPYEASQPGFLPPHVPGEGPMPMPMPHPPVQSRFSPPTPQIYIWDCSSASVWVGRSWKTKTKSGPYPPPPGHFPHPMPGQMGPGSSHFVHMGGHTATVLAPPGAATTVTVLQGEMFQTSPVQTVCPHCQQAIITRISHDVGLMNTLFCLFCFFVGCDLGCCLIPCLIDDLKDVTHTCPYCKGYIYTYKRIC